MVGHGARLTCSMTLYVTLESSLYTESPVRPVLMDGKCCQKILIFPGIFSENISPSEYFLSHIISENVPFVKYLQEFNF